MGNLKFARGQDIGKPEIGNLHSVGQVLVRNSQEISDNQDKISQIENNSKNIGKPGLFLLAH